MQMRRTGLSGVGKKRASSSPGKISKGRPKGKPKGKPEGGLVWKLVAVSLSLLAIFALGISIVFLPSRENGASVTSSGQDYSNYGDATYSQAPLTSFQGQKAVLKDGYQEITMDATYSGYSPNKFILKRGLATRWIIDGKEISGCNNKIIVPSYGLEFAIKEGVQTIEFTPNRTEIVRWSCWMNMIQGAFAVVDDLSNTSSAEEALSLAPAGSPAGSGGRCGCGCGGGR